MFTATEAPREDQQPSLAPPALQEVKARQRDAWSSGDYGVIGATIQIVGEQLCESVDLRAGQFVLDVAAGNGNASLAAARRWCEVTSTDFVPQLLERGRLRAAADGFSIDFREADAEALPFADQSFDVVLSTFGVMFTPDQEKAAAELARVCRRGGKIGLACWTPEGFIGQMLKTLGRHRPPPAGVESPVLWGTKERLARLFGASAASVDITLRNYVFRYRSAEHFVDFFATCYGPMLKAFAALDPDRRKLLRQDLMALAEKFNRSQDDSLVVPGEYIEAVIVRA
ncbi:class I SAM-dependent methyltransferase [Rhodoblastus sp.]|uniref:class I SAM-dependent methyltransferase n=1 Tax=Rhodoblastus sp. TaxID=1962975 RepID=UPI002636A7AD|nr:class I SAM-dependent methyltransferase [Rhodoblastus sp.]